MNASHTKNTVITLLNFKRFRNYIVVMVAESCEDPKSQWYTL